MTTIVTIDMGGTGATHAAGARSALSAAHENAYAQANAAYEKANTASSTGGGGYDQANAAYTQANSARSDANTTFETVNTTFLTINTTFGTINTSLSTMNLNLSGAQAWSNIVSFAAYGQANTARSDANTTFTTINTTFATVNTTFGTINTNYQAAYAQANTARDTANDAYNNSNTKLSTSGGSISGDLSITGNLVVQGNATTINVSNLSVNDSIILLATGGTGDSTDIGFIGHIQRDSTNTHVGLIRKATENRFYLFDNYEVEPSNNVIDVADNNFRVGNLRLNTINANSFVTSAGLDVTGQANAAYEQANDAYTRANTKLDSSGGTVTGNLTVTGTLTVSGNVSSINTQSISSVSNEIILNSNASGAPTLDGKLTINRGSSSNVTLLWNETADKWGWTDNGTTYYYFDDIRAGYAQANAAYGAANNRVLKAGDTMTGQLNISSGGLLVTGDVGFGSSPAFTTGSGLEIQRATATATLRLDSSSFATELYGYTGGTGLFQLSAGYLDLGTNNTTRLRITSDGNVGIGITTPNTVFNIYGGTAGNKTDLLAISHPANAGAQPVLRFDTIPANDNVLGRISVKDAGSYAGDMIFEVAATKGAASTTTTERMIIKNDGNVGIGATNPGAKLEIKGSGDGDLFIGRYSGGSAKLIYGYQSASDGFLELRTAADTTVTKLSGYTGTSSYFLSAVGIGTTSPSGKLHLYNSGDSLLYIEGGAGYEAGIWFRENGVNKWEIYKRSNPDDLNFYSSDLTASVMTLAAAGGVGIGTLSPVNARLHITGVGTGPDLSTTAVSNATAVFSNSDPDYGMYFAVNGNGNGAIQQRRGASAVYYDLLLQPHGGNVAIGTTSTDARLHVGSGGVVIESGASTGRSSYGIGALNLILKANTASGSGICGIDFRSGGNYPSDGAQIYYMSDSSGASGAESSRLWIRVENDAADDIYLRAGSINYDADTVDGGPANPSHIFKVDGGNVMVINSSGNVGVGNSAPDFKTIIQSDITKSGDINPGTAHLSLQGNSDVRKRMILGYDTNSNGFGFIKAGFFNNTWTTLSLQPDGGNVGIGTTSGAEKLHVVGNMVATGSITASYSDARFKDIISRIENPLQIISNIDAIFYRPNELIKSKYPQQEDRVFVGVTAQSVKEVLPEVVVPSPIDPEYDTVHYDRLVPVLIAAIQEQQKQIEELKAKLIN